MANAVKILINGSRGQMGQALVACAARLSSVKVVGEVDLGDDVSAVIDRCDVVIDFSFHSATAVLAGTCAAHGKALVIGTTGHCEVDKQLILSLGDRVRMVWASNYSMGVNTLFWLTRKAAQILGPGFDLEIVEMHHRLKKDAPSGTAATLAEILADVRGQQLKEVLCHGREGIVGARSSSEIGMHSVRGGDVVGDHTVIFATNGERLELTHKASTRETFAGGALRAACWVMSQRPGVYSMQEVLGLV